MRSFTVKLLAAGLLSAAFIPPAAATSVPGPIAAEVLRIVDGDTLEVQATIWLGQSVTTLVRISGIDAPELRARCDQEKSRAEAARALAADMMPVGGKVILTDVANGKYAGRVLAVVHTADGRDVAAELVKRGLAVTYDGRSRPSWCP